MFNTNNSMTVYYGIARNCRGWTLSSSCFLKYAVSFLQGCAWSPVLPKDHFTSKVRTRYLFGGLGLCPFFSSVAVAIPVTARANMFPQFSGNLQAWAPISSRLFSWSSLGGEWGYTHAPTDSCSPHFGHCSPGHRQTSYRCLFGHRLVFKNRSAPWRIP